MTQNFILQAARVTPRWLKSSRCKLLGGHQDDATVHVACARMTPIWLKSSCCVLLGWHKDDSKVHVSCGKGDSKMTQKFSFDECVRFPMRTFGLVFVYFWQSTKIFLVGICWKMVSYQNFLKYFKISWLEIRCLSETRFCGNRELLGFWAIFIDF